MPAANYNITIEQGSDFLREYQLLQADGVTPVDITGFTFESKLRLSASDPTVLATFTMTNTFPLLGKFTQALTNVQTAALTVEPSGTAVRKITTASYDIEMTAGAVKSRIVQGVASISPEVTR